MEYFTQDFIDFFKDLSANNHKEWFHANKKRYINSVKNPFEGFIGDLIKEIQQHDAQLEVTAKECVSRINRDIRFSADKTPYHTHYSGFISRGGKKDKSIPGIYLRFGVEEIGIMGGCYGLDKAQLHALRSKISNDIPSFQKLISAPDFVSSFGEIQGEENKRIPAEFQKAFEKAPIIAKKQYYFVAKEKSSLITSKNLVPTIMKYWHIARPVNEYLIEAR